VTAPGSGPPDLVFCEGGPLLVRGPVVVELPDGSRVRSDRPVSALCVCKRTRRPPFCDTSHRRKLRDDGPTTP
jgi:CDGSH-type Zn-finger protein